MSVNLFSSSYTGTMRKWKFRKQKPMFSKDNMQKHLCAQFLPCSGKLKSCEVPAKASTLWRCGGMKVWRTWALQHLKWKDGVPCFGCFSVFTLFSTLPTKDVDIYFRHSFLVILLLKRHRMPWIVVYSHTFLTKHICNFLVSNSGTEDLKGWVCVQGKKRTGRTIPQGQRTLPLSK